MWIPYLTVGLCCVLAHAQYQQVKDCPRPVDPAHGRARLLYGGLRAEYQCNPGYLTLGTNYALCAEGTWTWEAPLCVAAGCSVLEPMEHAFMAVSYSGAVVRFWCEDGFFLKGSPLLVCDGSRWNDSQPDCIGKSGRVAWGDMGRKQDFSFVHESRRRHKDHDRGKPHHEWLLEADYTCITTSSAVAPPHVAHASPSTQWVVEEGLARLYTVYRCKWGYVALAHTATLYCQHQQWVGPKPKCVFKGTPTPAASRPHDDDWSSYGKNAHEKRLHSADYSCFKAVEGVTAPDVTSATKIARHAVLDGMPHLYVEYQCLPGYSLDGPSEFLYCKDEKWHGDRPRCVWKGRAQGDDATLQTVCEQNNGGCSEACTMVGGQAVCTCSSGMELSADGQTCADVDECKTEDHGCAQVCFNTHGDYECLCREGFQLAADGFSCDTTLAVLRAVKQTSNDKVPPFVVFHNK